MADLTNIVDTDIKVDDAREAVNIKHSHSNKSILDDITSSPATAASVTAAQTTANTALTTAQGKQDPIIAGANIIINADGRTINAIASGGTTDHSALTNLSYATSGHTGFSPTAHTHNISDLSGVATSAQGTLADTALQSETDPVYTADKPNIAIQSDISNLQTQITSIENRGLFIGSFATKTDVPLSESAFAPIIVTINDYVIVQVDETQGGATTQYIATDIVGDVITWTFSFKFSVDTTGKMDRQPGAVVDNVSSFDNTGAVIDSGVAKNTIVKTIDSQTITGDKNFTGALQNSGNDVLTTASNALIGDIELPSGTNLDDVLIPGIYRTNSTWTTTITGKPFETNASFVLAVQHMAETGVTLQTYSVLVSLVGIRTFNRYFRATDRQWFPWTETLTNLNGLHITLPIPEGTDINTILDVGFYICPSSACSQTMLNLPLNSGGFSLEVIDSGIKPIVNQRLTMRIANWGTRTFIRALSDVAVGEWVEVLTTDNGVTTERLDKLGTAQTITCEIADLQATIDSLPKYLNRPVSISVNAGTYNGAITLSKFNGIGNLQITGSSAKDTTRTVNNISIDSCSLPYLSIGGFNLTSTTTPAVGFTFNKGFAVVRNMRIVDGTTTTQDGVYVSDSVGASIVSCEISNRKNAIQSSSSNTTVAGITGSGNTTAFLSAYDSTLRKRGDIVSTVTGTSINQATYGGIIIESDGTIVTSSGNTLTTSNGLFDRGIPASATDLNTLTSSGWYRINSTSLAQSMLNMPVQESGILVIYNHSDACFQEYFAWTSPMKRFQRSRVSSGFKEWQEVITSTTPSTTTSVTLTNGGSLILRKTGNLVTTSGTTITRTASSSASSVIGTLPAGYAPIASVTLIVLGENTTTATTNYVGSIDISSNSNIYVGKTSSALPTGNVILTSTSWFTS